LIVWLVLWLVNCIGSKYRIGIEVIFIICKLDGIFVEVAV
jgi:hypothetical protein